MAKMKPCPFCGSNPAMHEYPDGKGTHFIMCSNEKCEVQPQTSWYKTKAVVIKKWNTRLGEQARA